MSKRVRLGREHARCSVDVDSPAKRWAANKKEDWWAEFTIAGNHLLNEAPRIDAHHKYGQERRVFRTGFPGNELDSFYLFGQEARQDRRHLAEIGKLYLVDENAPDSV